MSPEYLPELALLAAGVFLAAVAVARLLGRRWVRALQLAGVSATLIIVGILSGKYAAWRTSESWSLRHLIRSSGLSPTHGESPGTDDGRQPTTVLVLGGVPMRTFVSDRYDLSVGNETFLTLDSLSSKLRVSCDVAGSQVFPIRIPRLAARISNNVLVFRGPGVRSARPDAHSMVVEENGTDIFRVRFVDSHRVEVSGRFYLSGGAEPTLIALVHGLRWPGGAIPYGSGIDLRPQGRGRIDFARSGQIVVLNK